MSDRRFVAVGDSLATLKRVKANTVDAMCSDPPAGISFMSKGWDGDKGGRDQWIDWLREIMAEALRVVKPGGHALVWAIPRTSHWTAMAMELAGWDIRDVITHHYGSGFPKSMNVSKAIDRHFGADRPVVGFSQQQQQQQRTPAIGTATYGDYKGQSGETTAPATPEAKEWEGWGTALKPASEHWILCRKPPRQSIAKSVMEHGTGALNVDGCRVGTGEVLGRAKGGFLVGDFVGGVSPGWDSRGTTVEGGRWPPNLLLTHSAACGEICSDDCPVAELDRQAGVSVSREGQPRASAAPGDGYGMTHTGSEYSDSGGASRFFPVFRYSPKPSRAEKEAGLAHLGAVKGHEATGRTEGSAGLDNPRAGAGRTAEEIRNIHPTVKGIDLMRWLVRLVTPPGGIVLDPFTGSGTTGVACVHEKLGFFGCELDPDYAKIARSRIDHAVHEVQNRSPLLERVGVDDLPPRQMSLLPEGVDGPVGGIQSVGDGEGSP